MHMQRTHLIIFSSIVLLLFTIIVVLNISQKPSENTTSSTGSTRGFSVPSILSDDGTLKDVLITNQEKARIAVQNIIRSWESRGDQRVIQSTEKAAPAITVLPELGEIQEEDIATLFKNLLGARLSDRLAQPEIEVPDTEVFWNGEYTSTQQPLPEKSETQTQIELRAYGNALATLITTFNQSQGDQSQILDTFINNRTQTTPLKQLTDNYKDLGKDIEELVAPGQLSRAHLGLIDAYISVGELLWELTLAGTDDVQLMERMLTYNKSSEEVAKHHISLITLFKANGVIFSDNEPGRVFSFTPGF